ncbi:hypothetical protein [Lysinibacillus xylanilyticus]|uniref:Uncharacterized protein n=1 Tax=Lysinibacillus xylanilyticus TaxID=582475 RepID=A0ABT4ET90_9BACI|nr:hypothetical protein [Lysinibacillus xylanilyticus]MCY9548893.1 hypothetical protein [Lysinibacillus xylanilyticus]
MQDIRPTLRWRNAKRKEEEEFTAGLIEKDDCVYAELFPEIMKSIETEEREELCDYSDQVLIQCGLDIDDLTKSQNLGRYELTDDWREW